MALSCTSAFAETAPDTSTAPQTSYSDVERQTHVVKAPVLIEADHQMSETVKRGINKVLIKPLDTLVAKEASSSDHNHFLYQRGKHANTKTKTYRPSAPKSEGMPNLFKK